jgi:signal transduction histidine kinase
MVVIKMELDMRDYQKVVKPGIHMVLLYDNDLEVIEPITSYICGCIERNERCIYIYGDTDLDKQIESLKKEIDYNFFCEQGQLIMMDKSDIYSKSGDFIPEKMIHILRNLVNESVKLGYSGMGITGELSWVLEKENGPDLINNYEWNLNDQIFEDYNISAVCRYNLNKFSDEEITNIIQLHPYIIYNNKIHENPYYLPPIAFKEKNIAKYQVNTWLNNIEIFSNDKSDFNRKISELNSHKKQLETIQEEKLLSDYNKYFTKALDINENLLSFLFVDLTDDIVIESKNHTLNGKQFTGTNFSMLVKNYKNSIMDKYKNLYISTFKKENLLKKFKQKEKIEIEYYQNINDVMHLVNTKIEFVLNPVTKHPIAFIYICDNTYKDATQKILNFIIEEQNDFVVQSNRNLKQVIMLSKETNILNFHTGNQILSFQEFDEVLKEFYNITKVSGEEGIKSAEQAFEIINMDQKHTSTYEFNVGDSLLYKQIVSYRYNEDVIYHLAYDVTDIVEKERLVSNKLEKSVIEKDEANKAKGSFLARMSHDMRTPLSAIMGLSDFGIKESESIEVRNYFNRIKVTSKYLLNLFNDILDMQKIEESTIKLRDSVNSTFKMNESVIDMINSNAGKKDINIIYKEKNNNIPKYLYFDDNRVNQIYINILSNAVKYSEKNSDVIWESEYYEENDCCFFKNRIIDSGVGMSKEFQSMMFDPFSTEENKLTKSEFGTGLGLAIAKNLIDIMDGEIYCDSILGDGTVFTIILPVGKVSELEKYKQLYEKIIKFEEGSLKGKRVLVCEDTSLNAKILSRILEDKLVTVDLAVNGLIGSELAISNNYDCILMDIRMPIMDGYQATQRIRENGVKTPIIAISANAYQEDVEKSLNSGMNEHMSKPINNELLLTTLAKYM